MVEGLHGQALSKRCHSLKWVNRYFYLFEQVNEKGNLDNLFEEIKKLIGQDLGRMSLKDKADLPVQTGQMLQKCLGFFERCQEKHEQLEAKNPKK